MLRTLVMSQDITNKIIFQILRIRNDAKAINAPRVYYKRRYMKDLKQCSNNCLRSENQLICTHHINKALEYSQKFMKTDIETDYTGLGIG